TTASTPTGTVPITVTGTPLGGVPVRTTTVNLVVNPPFDYSLSNTGNISVVQGSAGTTTITATLVAGTAQAVTLAASGLPVGATAAFGPSTCPPTCSSTLTITTTAS